MNTYFKEYSTNWIITVVNWMTDSKYRKYYWLDKFLLPQVQNPTDSVKKVASTFTGPYEKRIIDIQNFVYNNIKYFSDPEKYGRIEYWATADEVLKEGEGDCDDLNGLIYVLARVSGIPKELIYCALGNTSAGGHFWCMYLSPKQRKVYPIDATWNVDKRHIPYKKGFFISYLGYRQIWFIWNEEVIFKPK